MNFETIRVKIPFELEKQGFRFNENRRIAYTIKDQSLFCIDLVDVDNGNVYSYVGKLGTIDIFATDEISLKGYKDNIMITIEL